MLIAQRASQRVRGIFFGWWIILAGIGLLVLTNGLLGQAYGAYVVVLKEEFGWTATAFSIAYAIQSAESGMLGPFQGWLLDRFGPRAVVRAGVIILGVGLVVFSQIDSLVGFYLVFLFMAVGSSLGGFMSVTTTMINWFERRRGTAQGLIQIGPAVGGLLVPLVAWSLAGQGWRPTAVVSGILIILLGLPLAQLLRRRPEDYGMLPDGGPLPEPVPGRSIGRRQMWTSISFTARQALRTRGFWFISFGHMLGVAIVTAVAVHLIPFLTEDLNLSLATAASLVSLMTTCLLIGGIGGGMLGDRFDKRYLAVIGCAGSLTAMLLLAFATSLAMAAAGAALQGLSHGMRGTQMMPLRADYFGRQAFAKIAGISSFVMMWGIMAGPIMVGWVTDATGDYRLGFQVLSGAALVAAVCFTLARRPEPPRAIDQFADS
jgi:MFS family permease